MQRETGFVVVVVVLVALVVLAVHLARLRERVRRLERKATPAEVMSRLAAAELGQSRLAFEVQTQARLASAAQAQSVTELRALRDEFTTARVEQSATAIGARRAEKRAEAAAPPSESTEDPDEQRDTVAMPASKPSNDDGEVTSLFDPDPPIYAPRSEPMRPAALLAPLAHPDLIGTEDHADEAARSRLGPEEQTPPRRGRAALLVPVLKVRNERATRRPSCKLVSTMDYRTALITGASSGMGRSMARRLAREGTLVVLCARRVLALEKLAEEIAKAGGCARVLAMDVADTERTVASIREIDAEIGGLDLVIANAGVGRAIDAKRLRWERISNLCLVNFNGAIATLCAVLPEMVKRGRGHLVGVSSVGALAPFPTVGAYGATKAGLTMFLASLRFDLRDTGVDVTCVHPGFVRSEMTAHLKGPMPLALDADEAGALILSKLRKAPAEINFPASMMAMSRAIAALPAPVRDALLERFPVPDEDPE